MVRGDYLRGTWGWDRAWRAAGARELYGGVDAEFTFDSGMESIFMRRGREQELLLGFGFVLIKSISRRIFIICMFKEHNLLILLRWRVENNLNMEDEWGRSAACTGELLWGKGVAASIWTPIWTWILHARAMCTQCTVPRRVQDEYELDWGKQHTNKTNKDRGGQVESWPRNAKSRTWRMVNVGTWNTVSVEATKG